MILSTLVTSQLHFEMCAGLYGHPVCYLRTWKRGESFIFILNKHTRCTRVYIAALTKTAQQSGNSSGKVAFNPSVFFPGVSSLKALANELNIF